MTKTVTLTEDQVRAVRVALGYTLSFVKELRPLPHERTPRDYTDDIQAMEEALQAIAAAAWEC